MFQQWWFQQWWQSIGNWFAPKIEPQALEEKLGELRQQAPIPVLWLFGKTQSGKSSVVRFLTRAEKAEIGSGFRPCTRHSSLYDFPDAQAPLMQFLDTRGLDEPGYEASEDLAAFDKRAHVLLVTVKLLDHAQENVLAALRKIRMARPQRPVVLLLTCLHEAYPQQQHPDAYLFDAQGQPTAPVPEVLRQNLDTQRARFGPLVDRIV
ncbi:MAG: GTPase domain-containing protein, partial [Gemmataceae bacterium]